MSLDLEVKMNLNPNAKRSISDAIEAGVSEVFELDIKPAAVEGSPVKTGTNRRSIDVEVKRNDEGMVTAELFTQSGYGGYLELGTRFMRARAYLYPAFMQFRDAIAATVGRRINDARVYLKQDFKLPNDFGGS